MDFRKNATLILGLSVPLLMIAFVAGSIYLPALFIKPRFNFVYLAGSSDYMRPLNYSISETKRVEYSVQDGKLVRDESDIPESDRGRFLRPTGEPKLYLHDVSRNESTEISFTDAQKLTLDTTSISPDGFEIVSGSRGDGFIFYWSEADYGSRYLKGRGVAKKLKLKDSHVPYLYDFRFVGWAP